MMFVGGAPECTRTHMPEHLELVLRSLRDLDQRRICQEVLVRTALGSQEVLVTTALETEEPGRDRDQNQGWKGALKENVLLLKEQLRCLRRRDAGLLSQLQELDRQILELRLDTPESCDHSPETSEALEVDSRPSSGFYDLSYATSGSLSNSVFSLCSTLDTEAMPTLALTTLTSGEAPPTATDEFHQRLLHRSLSAPPFSSSSSAPSFSSSVPDSSASPLCPCPQKHLDLFISSLLQRRFFGFRPTQPRTNTLLLGQTGLAPRTTPSSASPASVLLMSPKRTENVTFFWEEAYILGPQATSAGLNELGLSRTAQNSAGVSPSPRERKKPEENTSQRVAILGLKLQKSEPKAALSGRRSGPSLMSGGLIRDRVRSVLNLKLRHKQRKDTVQEHGSRSSSTENKTRTWTSQGTNPRAAQPLTLEKKSRPEDFRTTRVGRRTNRTRTRTEVWGRLSEDGSRPNLRRDKRTKRRRRSGVEEEPEVRESIRTYNGRTSLVVKPRTKLSQSHGARAVMSHERSCRSPIREKSEEEEGMTEEETGSEGARPGRGRARRQQLVRIKASQNLKKRILQRKTSSFRLMTTV